MTTAGSTAAWRWTAALATLWGAWAVGCEALRERAPVVLAVYLAGPWLLAARAWRARLAPGHLATAGLVAGLLALDAAADAWIPYEPRFLHAPWQLARAVVLALAAIRATSASDYPRFAAITRATCAAVPAAVAVAMLAIGLTGVRDATRPADAAVVLGFALDAQGRAQPSLVARVDHAARLYRAGVVPTLVLTGGVGRAGGAEADVMRDLARARGVPDAALVLEPRARTTAENFALSAPLVRARGARTVLVVTEPFHMPRALLLARRAGLDARPSPARASPAWRDARSASYWLFRDAIAYLAERARGPFARWATGPSGAR